MDLAAWIATRSLIPSRLVRVMHWPFCPEPPSPTTGIARPVVHAGTVLASPATDTAVAIGTSAAAVISLATLAFLCYQWAKDKRERRAEEEQKQAARINCWFIPTPTEHTGAPENAKYKITGKLEWFNRSEDPVYSVLIIGIFATQEIHGFPLVKRRRAVNSPDRIIMPVVAPGGMGGQEYSWTFNANEVSVLSMEFILSWQFNDARGVTWLKNSRGAMKKMPPSPETRDALVAHMLPMVQHLAKEAEDVATEARSAADKAWEIAREYGVQGEADTSDKPPA